MWLDDLQLDEVGPSRVTGHLAAGPEHHQRFGIVHGGVWASIVEAVASAGASAAAPQQGQATVVGVANHTDSLRRMSEGRVDVVGTPVHVGRTQQLWLVEITRATDGKLVARGEVRLQTVVDPPRN